MKTKYILLIIISLFGILTTSCEKQCICHDYTTNSTSEIYSAYSKKECKDAEEYFSNLVGHGHEIECSYERKK
ncbi:MAG: hypothetical protein KBT67_09235 [bacterium]|nr:hypothetical protein [Candidatus Limimorpha caballi]MCQ2316823.1 hypothetical protein [Bacteroidales bacterium]